MAFLQVAFQRFAEDATPSLHRISPEDYAEFLTRLDAPRKPNARLKRALQTTHPGNSPCRSRGRSRSPTTRLSSLDDWLRRRARANQVSGASRTFVATEDNRVVG